MCRASASPVNVPAQPEPTSRPTPPMIVALVKAARMDDRTTNSLPAQAAVPALAPLGLQAMKPGPPGFGRSLDDHQIAAPPLSASHVCQVSVAIAPTPPDW